MLLHSCYDGLHDFEHRKLFGSCTAFLFLSLSLYSSPVYSRYDLTVHVCIDNNVIIVLRQSQLTEQRKRGRETAWRPQNCWQNWDDRNKRFAANLSNTHFHSQKQLTTLTKTVRQTNISSGIEKKLTMAHENWNAISNCKHLLRAHVCRAACRSDHTNKRTNHHETTDYFYYTCNIDGF